MDTDSLSTREVYITTSDNPYDPADQFDEWFAYDEAHGYHTCSLLDRIANTSLYGLSDEYNTFAIERAIDEIIRFSGETYVKIVKE